ncbi:MAG: hypothetical protein A2W99_06195 [Bacteroidetes bacterium GWF2_33_16]|nr:MAG: hypothetical protein A2X00_12700 [Bacteroidetes bacterium GWE2_32_14]OFY05271.1 MAG: hypothetical protein A2W99_06195 [Bacteroidetes bacterium GWF2_33_16]
MNIIKFKTSLKCGGCINAIRPHLNKIDGIQSWDVDLDSPNKTLSVNTEAPSTEDLQNTIIIAFKKAGYSAELIK